mmetsp:Transcript_47169/g.146122  ORF Transcript_47169/g.146122 Transcript_47169/m.146122 type:complete len:211 (+) Transcript_47169:1498-2130(+)
MRESFRIRMPKCSVSDLRPCSATPFFLAISERSAMPNGWRLKVLCIFCLSGPSQPTPTFVHPSQVSARNTVPGSQFRVRCVRSNKATFSSANCISAMGLSESFVRSGCHSRSQPTGNRSRTRLSSQLLPSNSSVWPSMVARSTTMMRPWNSSYSCLSRPSACRRCWPLRSLSHRYMGCGRGTGAGAAGEPANARPRAAGPHCPLPAAAAP